MFQEDFSSKVKQLKQNIDDMLVFCTKNSCSDLFIKVGEPAQIYRYGILYQTMNPIDELAWNQFSRQAITSELNTTYVREKMVDFSYEVKGFRYRVNAGFSTGKNIATFRMISDKLPSFQSLKLGEDAVNLLYKAFTQKQGISILAGATGSGKTSTLAACINSFSAGYGGKETLPLKDAHLITLEDPIEYRYPTLSSTRIDQKELGKDFLSFDLGIKSALREHPTHVLVGETRDKTTIRSLIELARTGHSCITTFHTSSVSDTISRLYSYLAADNRDVMFDLIANMNFVLCQQLVKGRTGYTLRYQYMFFIPEIKKVLTEAIYQDSNIPRVVDNLMGNASLVKNGLCHDWQSNK